MEGKRSNRARKTIDYTKFADGDEDSDDDDDFTSSTPPVAKKQKKETKPKAKKAPKKGKGAKKEFTSESDNDDFSLQPKKNSQPRTSLDEKYYDKDLQLAMELSIMDASQSSKASSSLPTIPGISERIIETVSETSVVLEPILTEANVEPNKEESSRSAEEPKQPVSNSEVPDESKVIVTEESIAPPEKVTKKRKQPEENVDAIEVLEENVTEPTSRGRRRTVVKKYCDQNDDDSDDNDDDFDENYDDDDSEDDFCPDDDSDDGFKVKKNKKTKSQVKEKGKENHSASKKTPKSVRTKSTDKKTPSASVKSSVGGGLGIKPSPLGSGQKNTTPVGRSPAAGLSASMKTKWTPSGSSGESKLSNMKSPSGSLRLGLSKRVHLPSLHPSVKSPR